MNEIYKPLSLAKVVRAGEKIIGYICADQVLDEGHILNVTVHPEHRRRVLQLTWSLTLSVCLQEEPAKPYILK